MSTIGGLTLIEMLVSLALAGLIMAGLGGVIGQAFNTYDSIGEQNRLTEDGRFAMEAMTRAVSHSHALLLPLNDNPATAWQEHIREQSEQGLPPFTTAPISGPPIGAAPIATAVLAIALPAYFDLDRNGIADADDDGDGLIDEDFGSNRTASGVPGIYLIDDDGDGMVDEGIAASDDETASVDSDPINGIDDDGDISVDEDPPADMNADGCPGKCDIDDDFDGDVDEGSSEDDDEDGDINEDPFNPLVFYLMNGQLFQRTPVPYDIDSDNDIDGQDFIAQVIAENVSRFRVERILPIGAGPQLIDIAIDLTSSTGATVSLQTRVRLGGAL
ncbi:MAG: hypothetical protein HKO71_01770 [Pseudomonadales bacterium]|nr:hypothetical protein [Pseudomonadales bacterium]